MRTVLLFISVFFSLTAFSQIKISMPGDAKKTMTIKGELLGEMIRSTGGVDKKSEKYYYKISDGSLTIWKHIHLLEEDNTEALYITNIPLNDVDWAYFESSFPDGPTIKKSGGKEYHILSINTQRGKRFKQEKYFLDNDLANVTVGYVDLNLNDKEAIQSFYTKFLAAKK
jgi:hypothetical protein